MRTDGVLSSRSSGGQETHTEQRQQEGVEVPEHEFLEDLSPFQEVGDVSVLLGLATSARGSQPFAL